MHWCNSFWMWCRAVYVIYCISIAINEMLENLNIFSSTCAGSMLKYFFKKKKCHKFSISCCCCCFFIFFSVWLKESNIISPMAQQWKFYIILYRSACIHPFHISTPHILRYSKLFKYLYNILKWNINTHTFACH